MLAGPTVTVFDESHPHSNWKEKPMSRRFTTYAKPMILAILVYACLGIAMPRETRAWSAYKVLSVPSIGQLESNWCWAASTQAVLAYKGISASQCKIVNIAKGTTSCSDVTGTVYNVSHVLHYYGFAQADAFSGKLSMTQIQSEIDAYRPVVAAWWTTWTGGHMVTIRGYYRDNYGDNVYFVNPANGGFYDVRDYWWFEKEPNHTWTFTVWRIAR
jgi:hypothetical protein